MRINLLSLLGMFLIALTLPLGFGGGKSNADRNSVMAAQGDLAAGNDLYCAGYISAEPVTSKIQIIGGEEKYTTAYSESNKVVYLSQGEKDDVKVGNIYSVVRPLGKFKNEFSKKNLGFLTGELGMVRVIASQYSTATVEVLFACEDF